ncbi:ATP-dependent DNA helicase RecG [bacterium CG10_46_32]|nr:MAG: ATP-dependent DNA helicase RecG [bacterium CG10_46_32]PIR56508.1 MAG: ATP-dependent DNA helicase RecG [Parcubacteria group bacterium CG10_big_fil_rev_8_21_14_0_10_46_32]
MSTHLSTPIKQLTRVGAITAARLAKLGIGSVLDLLNHYPTRYEDYSARLSTASLSIGALGTMFGTIGSIETKKTAKKHMQLTQAELLDDAGSIRIVWFNQPYITNTIHKGDHVAIAGTVAHDFSGWVLKNPQFEKIEHPADAIHTSRLVPLYPLTGGLTQKQVRFLVHQALQAAHEMPDILPKKLTEHLELIATQTAIQNIHLPKDAAAYLAARKRLGFEELFIVQLLTERARKNLTQERAPKIPFNETATKKLVASLPFDLTADQRKAAWKILQDMEQGIPMNRLVQGEVGSGKTVVAAIAALNAASAGFQTAFMAPTEILALQHYQTIATIFPHHTVALLTSKHARMSGLVIATPLKNGGSNLNVAMEHVNRATDNRRDDKIAAVVNTLPRNDIKKAISDGNVSIIIGTHAIIQHDISFSKLGLIIIDEQHRFGVAQRKQLKDKTANDVPHLLSMTATPIPRSLALTLYGDLDITTIKQMPKGRKPITTRVVDETNRTKAYQFIKQHIAKKEQVFVICPLIEESDSLGVASATAEYEKLRTGVFKETSIGLLHGKLKSAEKEHIMSAFKSGEILILVATAVVEVGVDVPAATIMIIEGADRFGLSQLHQFRGRVGRSDRQSYCFLFTDSTSPETHNRLQKFVHAKDGFEIAELDLSLRGPGKMYGTEQSGRFTDLKIASLADGALLEKTKEAAQALLKEDPELKECPLLLSELERQSRELHFE